MATEKVNLQPSKLKDTQSPQNNTKTKPTMPLPSERVYDALWESVFDHQHQYHWEHLELDTCDPKQFLVAADEIVVRMQQILKHFQILRNYQAGRLLVRSGMTQSEVLDEYNVSTFRQRVLVHTY